MRRLINAVKAPLEIGKIIARHEPSYLWWSLPQMAISSVLPLLTVYAPKLIIEKLTDKSPFADVFRVIVLYCAVLLALGLLNGALSGKSGFAADKFAKKLRYEIGKIAMRLEMKDIETASGRETIVYVGQSGTRKNGEGILNRLKEHHASPKQGLEDWYEAVAHE